MGSGCRQAREIGCKLRSSGDGIARVAVTLLLMVGTSACSFTVGSTESDSSWRAKVDQTLGAGVGSLGTAGLLLANQANGHLTRNFVVVGMHEALATLESETSKFVELQPPPTEKEANRRAVAALGKARAVLSAAATAATGGDAVARATALREVRTTYSDLQDLSDKLAG